MAVVFAAAGAMAQPAGTQLSATQPAAGEAGLVTPRLAPKLLPPAGMSDQAPAELLHRLLAGDRDARLLKALAERRDLALRTDANALDGLARGLRVYLTIGPALAADPLEIAAANPNVYALTIGMPEPLDKLAARCHAEATVKPSSFVQAGPCYKCGDTRQMPCSPLCGLRPCDVHQVLRCGRDLRPGQHRPEQADRLVRPVRRHGRGELHGLRRNRNGRVHRLQAQAGPRGGCQSAGWAGPGNPQSHLQGPMAPCRRRRLIYERRQGALAEIADPPARALVKVHSDSRRSADSLLADWQLACNISNSAPHGRCGGKAGGNEELA